MSNKKAQLGEMIEDLPAFIIIIFILVLLVIFSIFIAQKQQIEQARIDKKILHDDLNLYIYALLQEKNEGIYFSDMIRARDDSYQSIINERLDKIKNICSLSSYGCSYEIIYENALEACQEKPEKGTEYFCYFIPSNDIMAVKITTVHGVNLM